MTEELAIERVAHYPMPGMNAPSIVRFSPDGRLLTYLWSEDASLVRQLWAFDLVTGETRVLLKAPGQGDTDQTVSPDEALRRERLRMRGFGITSYAWAERQPLLLVPMLGRLYVSDDLGRSLLELSTDGEAIDPHLSPSGDRVAYVQDGDLWVIGTAGGAEPKRLTFGAPSPTGDGGRLITNGLAEFIAQEEMGRSQGFWWSQDGSLLAFQQTDVSEVSQFMIVHDSESPPSTESHRYPFAGGPNARVRLGVIGADGSNPRWVPLPGDKDIYLARVDWTPGGLLLIQIEQRDQRRLDLLAYDPSSQSLRTVLSESSDNWINLHDDLRVVGADTETSDSYSILWSSERSGYRHLYLYNSDGQEITQLTTGDWPVDRVVDARGGWVYFLAGRDSPLERHLYRVRLSEVGSSRSESDGLQKLSAEPGMHSAVLAP